MKDRPAWGAARAADYFALPLRSHVLLDGVPLHDVWFVDLPGGGAGRTVDDVRALMTADRLKSINPLVKALFAFRRLLGKLFGWDGGDDSSDSFLPRLDPHDRDRSTVEPGTLDGPFRVLYVHEHEAVSEALNRTVHAFLVLALLTREGGYRMYWAIHVMPVGRITPLYMALIDPFRRLVVYPAILRRVHRAWEATSW